MASITSIPTNQIPEIEPAPGLFTSEQMDTPYGVYNITVRYTNNQGNIAVPLGLPIGSTDPSVDVIDLFAPFCLKIVDWTATQVGLFPLVPTAFSNDDTLTLLKNDYWPMPPRLQTDGVTKIYGMAGVYVYACARPVQEEENIALSFAPYQQNTGEEFPAENFVQGIVG